MNTTGFQDKYGAWPDVVAGLCVAGLLLPEAVAYAGLAHLPVGHALTAVVVGLVVYALFGGSRFAIVAPTSSTAALAAAAAVSMTGAWSAANAAAYTQVLMALVILSGLMLMLLAAARQGQLSSYVSRPVLKGFAFALALTIVIKQLPDALGHELAKDDGGEGDQRDHDGCGRNGRRLVSHAKAVQPARHTGAEGGLANDAVEHTDRGDANLHGR